MLPTRVYNLRVIAIFVLAKSHARLFFKVSKYCSSTCLKAFLRRTNNVRVECQTLDFPNTSQTCGRTDGRS